MQLFNGSRLVSEQIGEGSRCMDVRRLAASGERDAADPVCLRATCEKEGLRLAPDLEPGGGESVSIICPFGDKVRPTLRESRDRRDLCRRALTLAWLQVTVAPPGRAAYTIDCPMQLDACPQFEPPPPCPNACSDNGVCRGVPPVCVCDDGWTGADCSQYQCSGEQCAQASPRQGAFRPAEVMGSCVGGQCVCEAGFTGANCRVPQPECDIDCSLLVRPTPPPPLFRCDVPEHAQTSMRVQGPGMHCFGSRCERQCSSSSKRCHGAE